MAIVALPVGVSAPCAAGGWLDRLADRAAFAGISLPVFWFGLVLQIVFAVALGWLPSSGRSDLRRRRASWIGCSTSSCRRSCWPSRRGRLVALPARVDGRRRPAAVHLAARARGVPERSVWLRHALRNAVIPALTVVMLDAGVMVSGAVVTESVFAWPGVGSLFTEALARRDYTVLMAFLMVAAVAVVVFNLGADLLHWWLDPRVAGALREAAVERRTGDAGGRRGSSWPLISPAPRSRRRSSRRTSPEALDLANRRARAVARALVRHRRARPRRPVPRSATARA